MEISVDRSLRHWWVFVIKGVLFIALGIYMICQPAGSFAALGFLFGLVIFLTGVAELIRATRERSVGNRQWHLMLGIIDIILGILFMVHVTTSMAVLRIVLGLWFLFGGASLFLFSRYGGRSLTLLTGAILAVVFGSLVLFSPTFGDTTIILWTAIAIITMGFFNVLLGFRIKAISK